MTGQSKQLFPGLWIGIHITAAWSDSPEKNIYFCLWIRNLIEHLPCEECSNHARLYLSMYPPERCEDSFVWSWQFHNSVNERLGKPIMGYAEARRLFLGGEIKLCNGNCPSG